MLATGAGAAVTDTTRQVAAMVKRHGAVAAVTDLKDLMLYIVSECNRQLMGARVTSSLPILQQVVVRAAGQLWCEMERQHQLAQTLETALCREFENSRLLRVSVKLNMILERDVLLNDTTWAVTGDRYILSLLRDYIYH